MKKVNIKHQIDLFSSITDVAGRIGSRRDNPQDDVSLAKLARDEDKNSEKSNGVSSNENVLSRKDDDNDGTGEIELTKVFEFVPARKPEQAKIGELVRFMHNLGNGQSAYWMQGRLERRVDRYNVSRQSGFTRNRFKVKELSVVNHWGELGDIPETLTVNLSKNTAWSLGNEVEMQTIEKNEEIMLHIENRPNISLTLENLKLC